MQRHKIVKATVNNVTTTASHTAILF